MPPGIRYASLVSRLTIQGLFRITPALREKHDYRRDGSFDGRYLRRLPDRTLVPADEYDERLKSWKSEHGGLADK